MKTLFKRSAIMLVICVTLFGSAIGVKPAYAATLTVTNTNDSGAGSLRDTLASAAPSDTINFDDALAGGTIHLASSITISQNVTIDGSSLAIPITISGDTDSDGGGDVMIFVVNSGVTVVIDSLILTKGNAANDNGGAIYNDGVLTVNNSTLTGNYALNGGGAIYSSNAVTVTNSTFVYNTSHYGGGAMLVVGTLNVSNSVFSSNYTNSGGGGGAIYSAATTTVTNSSFTDNTAYTVNGGGIYVVNGTTTVTRSTFTNNYSSGGSGIAIQNGTLYVANSTFYGNTTDGIAGGIYNVTATLNLYNSTFSNNIAGVGDGVFNGGTMYFANNLIANSSTQDCYNIGTISSNVNNHVETGNCTSMSADPQLGVLADNGGTPTSSGEPPLTVAPLPGSPVIDAGDSTTCQNSLVGGMDQRGVPRPIGTCDIGAVEYVTTYLVTKAADTNDGTCNTDCSLREAIVATNADSNGDSIIFNGDYTITLGSKLPTNFDDLTIDGKGHTIVIDGNNHAILETGDNLNLKNLTLQNGNATEGGAIRTAELVTIVNVTFINNTGTDGGAIYSLDTLIIKNSTFINNSGYHGGAINNDAGTLTISNSTFSGNSAHAGGAIYSPSGTLTINNSTLSDNSSTILGAGIYSDGLLKYANNIIANSTTGADCAVAGTIGINYNNLVEDGSCSASLSGDPNLAPLGSNGGSTQTFALLANSTAINAGNDAVCSQAPVSDLDQRGTTRPNGPHCDIGAYEYVDTTAPTITAFSAPATSASLNIPITTFTASDDVSVTGYKITESATPPAANAAGWTASAPTTYTVAGAGAYTLYPWAKDAIGNVSAVYGSPANVTVDTTAPTVLSSVRVNPNPTNKLSVQFTVSFSEAVTGVDTTDFSLTKTGVTGGSVSSVSGSGATRTVTINTGSGNGTIRLDVKASGTNIQDIAGNALSGGFTTGQSYTVNKTLTFTSTGTQDGWVLETSELSGLGGTLDSAATTFRLGDDASNKQYRDILSFTTSSIPDNAVITGVMLKVKYHSATDGGNMVAMFQGFMTDIKKGIFGSAATLQPSDFQAAASTTLGPTSPVSLGGWYSLNLTAGKTFINKLTTSGGLTQIRLRFKLDDNNNAVTNYLSLYSSNAAAATRPQLVITYYVP